MNRPGNRVSGKRTGDGTWAYAEPEEDRPRSRHAEEAALAMARRAQPGRAMFRIGVAFLMLGVGVFAWTLYMGKAAFMGYNAGFRPTLLASTLLSSIGWRMIRKANE